MGRTKYYQKNIACLESLWDNRIANQHRLGVAPILEIASRIHQSSFAHMTCNTIEELKFNLRMLSRRKGYDVVYFAMHGRPGVLALSQGEIELQELAAIMKHGFSNRIVHFGSCSTLDVKRKRIRTFLKATQIPILIGYVKDPNWIESSAVDLLVFDQLQRFRNMRSFWADFRYRYPNLISQTGLRAFLL